MHAFARLRVVAVLRRPLTDSLTFALVTGLYPTTPHWNDTAGNRIEAHAAGMLFDESAQMWYWYGESKKTNDLSDHGVNCYSAKTLNGPWTFEGQVIKQSSIPTNGSNGPFVIERPKVIYNKNTKLFVCWVSGRILFMTCWCALCSDSVVVHRVLKSRACEGIVVMVYMPLDISRR